MDEKIACYSFLPWARKGIGSKIKEKENFGNDAANDTTERASIDISVKIDRNSLSDETDTFDFPKGVHLYGPGDIIGIDKRAIIRVEPKDGVTNFEYNYLPYIEFYEEDFLWRYTPAVVNDSDGANSNIDKRLRPWLALLVFKEEDEEANAEFRFEKFNPNDPQLPFITILKDNLFPKNNQYWAWGHVHVNQSLDEESGASISGKLNNLVQREPNFACSRLLCPRKLERNTKYHAFLVPAYEKGRLAGLGEQKAVINTVVSQEYSSKNTGTKMPYYYNWSFRTGADGDFEELVRKLESMPIDDRVGRRLMDIQSPGYGLVYGGNSELITDIADPTDEKGAIYLEGALKPPKRKTKNFAESGELAAEKMVEKMEGILNLDSDLRNIVDMSGKPFEHHPFFKKENGTPESIQKDPIIMPPIYGRWHNLKDKVDKDKPNRWINHLNLDPRQRTVAGFGTKVIQKKQEEYIDRAWGQFEGIRDANNKLKQAQYVERFSSSLFKNKIAKIPDDSLVITMAKLHSRILSGEKTLSKSVTESRLSNAVVLAEFRKISRPKGALKTLNTARNSISKVILKGSNAGTKQAAIRYDKVAIAADGSVKELSNALGSVISNPTLNTTETIDTLSRSIDLTGRPVAAAVNIPTANNGPNVLATTAQPTNIAATNVNLIPKLKITLDGDRIVVKALENLKPEAKLQSLTEQEYLPSQLIYSKYLQSPNWTTIDPGEAISFKKVAKNIKSQLRPEELYTKRVLNRLHFGKNIEVPEKEVIEPIFVAPHFDDAMYEPMRDLSSEYFVPNLNLIKNNSISILETNQEFIESYMVGLNHEFSRELLWREYLTDQRGSYFRQFWDVTGNPGSGDLSDIKPIHEWKNRPLGKNTPISTQAMANRLVLVIRGDLLRKYPNTIVQLQKARFNNPANPDITIPREIEDGREILYPAFEAKIDPDIYFFGFNITVDKARGKLEMPDRDPGYFVVLKERTGQIHFGMDIDLVEEVNNPILGDRGVILGNGIGNRNRPPLPTPSSGQGPGKSWNSLSWDEFSDNLSFIDLEEDIPDKPSRENVTWGANSADMAYILYQNPFMMAIHTSKMVSEEMLNI
jgi:hypothetical protein